MAKAKGSKSVDNDVGPILQKLMRLPLLSHGEELALGRRIAAARQVREQATLEAEADTGITNGKKRARAAARAMRVVMSVRAQEAPIQEFMLRNVRLVLSIARKYRGKGVLLQDLVTHGMLGARKAAERFDAELGLKFSTYATWWIRQAIQRAINDEGRNIRVPVNKYEDAKQILQATELLRQRYLREPTDDEVAAYLHMTRAQLDEIKISVMSPTSLDAERSDEDEGQTLGNILPDRQTSVDDTVIEQQITARVQRAILRIKDVRIREVMLMRFGLLHGSGTLTLADIGKLYDLSRERIRQLEGFGLKALHADPILNAAMLE